MYKAHYLVPLKGYKERILKRNKFRSKLWLRICLPVISDNTIVNLHKDYFIKLSVQVKHSEKTYKGKSSYADYLKHFCNPYLYSIKPFLNTSI